MPQTVGVWIYDPNRRGYGFMPQTAGVMNLCPKSQGVMDL